MHIKQVDSDGRIILPQEYRRMLTLKNGSSVAISLSDEKIEIMRYQDIDAVKHTVKKAINSHYAAYGLPIVACDEEKIFSSCGLDYQALSGTSLPANVKRQVERNYEYVCRDPEHMLHLVDGSELVIKMIAPLRKDNRAIGAIMLIGCAESFKEVQGEWNKSITLLTSLIQQQINMM